MPAIASIITVLSTYALLISEKVNKVVVVMLASGFLIISQVFSQEDGLHFVSKNLDVLGFILGMMILIGIVKESGFFEALAIRLVKAINGNPKTLIVAIGLLTYVMTVFLSNIPTVLIIVPILIVLIRQLKLPYLPYFFVVVSVANVAGASTPISDPTTYYQAKTVGLSFIEVLANSGLIAFFAVIASIIYTLVVFNKQLSETKVSQKDVALFKPEAAIKDKTMVNVGIPILVVSILLIIAKDFLKSQFGLQLDNASIILTSSFLVILIFNINVNDIFKKIIDWEIIFFFIGLFIVVGSLEHTGVIEKIAEWMVQITEGSQVMLTFVMTLGSSLVSVMIDNVPYNITMVSAIQAMEVSGVEVYPLWWALNLGTSIGGAGSLIGAACNVVAFGQAEHEGFKTNFIKYILLAVPLVIINSLIAFAIIWLKFLD